MNKIITNDFLEYFSLILVLSFLIFNKALLIITRFIIALYSKVKKNGFKYPNIEITKKDKTQNQKNKSIIRIFNLKLIEEVEGFGFIPSSNDINKKMAN